jgi:hypothetical protein
MNSTKLRKIILEELSMRSSARTYRRPRKLGLADYLGESSDRHLLELDDDSIISTGMRIREGLDDIGYADGIGDGDDPEVVANTLGTGSSDEPAASTPAAAPSTTVAAAEPEIDLTPAPALEPAMPPTPEPVGAPIEAPADVDDDNTVDPSTDSSGDDNDDSEFIGDADVPPTSDGLGDSIMNSLFAGAAGEDARRQGAPAASPALPPSPVDVAGPEATTNITDKRALSTYLDQVARGERSITLESRKIEIAKVSSRKKV